MTKYQLLLLKDGNLGNEKLVYVACANKFFRYKNGRSKIIYFGTTRNGIWRIASSAARKAKDLLIDQKIHGVNELNFYIIRAKRGIPGLKYWVKLERALIVTHKELFGEAPKGNKHGKNMKWKDGQKYFRYLQIREIVSYYAEK